MGICIFRNDTDTQNVLCETSSSLEVQEQLPRIVIPLTFREQFGRKNAEHVGVSR